MSPPPLLDEAIAAHGGSAFDTAGELSADVACGGWAFPLKFQRAALAGFTGRISTSEPRAELAPYPKPGRRGILEGGAVRIEDDAGRVLAERANPRASFERMLGGRRNLWWDDLDLLYFGGYALWGYLNAPFIFRSPGFEVEETDPWQENGETWRGLRVTFPPDVPAHSREQCYYFDAQGLLRRNDYTAEAFGRWAKATHYCWDHREFSGVVVPTRRKAMPRRRDGRPLTQVGLVSIAISDVRLGPAARAA